jgi:membrane-associated phospholipid phosphatase
MDIYFFFATWGQWVIATSIVFVVLLRAARLRRAAQIEVREAIVTLGWVSLVGFCAWVFVIVLKLLFPVARPFVSLGLEPALSVPYFDSFPSGHAFVLGAVATAMFLLDRKLGWWCTVVAVVTAVSRVFLGVHTYIDIFFGYFLGGILGIFTGAKLLRLRALQYFIPKLK